MRRFLGLSAAAVALLSAVVTLTACGSGGGSPKPGASAADLVDDAFASGNEITSGRLELSAGVEGTKIRLSGPFEAESKGHPARFDLSVRASQKGTSLDLGVVSTGGHTYLRVKDRAYDLGDATGSSVDLSLTPSDVDVRPWLRDPKVVGTEKVGDADTTHVRAGLDATKALDGLDEAVGKAGDLGDLGGLGAADVTGEIRKRIRQAKDSLKVDLWIGEDDDTLRRLRIDVAGLAADVEVTDVGEAQDIEAPAHARSLTDLTGDFGKLFESLAGTPSA